MELLLTLQICSNPAVRLASASTCEECRVEEGEGGTAARVPKKEELYIIINSVMNLHLPIWL